MFISSHQWVFTYFLVATCYNHTSSTPTTSSCWCWCCDVLVLLDEEEDGAGGMPRRRGED